MKWLMLAVLMCAGCVETYQATEDQKKCYPFQLIETYCESTSPQLCTKRVVCAAADGGTEIK
jgi:hypothetical protein